MKQRISRETREKQIAIGLCVCMSVDQMCQALELRNGMVRKLRAEVMRKAGMADATEFALTQNAAVREQVYG